MRLAKNALMSALIMLAMLIAVTAQTPRSADDNRNLAPAVGTGGSIGGPTGLFTVYDGATLRRGEYTFSAAYSNFDRDPGDVDITEVPISFQIGLSDHIELFFNTDAYRQVKVNSFRNLSSFYLPNSQFFNSTLGVVTRPGAIVYAPQGATPGPLSGTAVYRRAGAPFVQFPFVGGSFGNNGFGATTGVSSPFIGPAFGFAAGTNPTYGAPIAAGDGAALFPGYGSVYGSILPGVVLTTQTINLGGTPATNTTAPLAYTVAPSYLPDAPFINRTYGQTAFNTFTVGGKIRFTGPDSPYGIGVIPFYRFYADKADDFAGFNQMQRGSGPGSNRGDFGAIGFADARLRQWLNVSVNVGYINNGDVKAEFPTGSFTILDRPDELLYGAALDFPVNKYFQPIAEFRGTRYVGGRTPNAFENHPMDALAGVRIFPRRWFGMGFAYRYNINQQDEDAVEDTRVNQTVRVIAANGAGFSVASNTALGPDAFRRSSDPHGFIGQFFIGRRNSRGVPPPVNQVPNVTALNLDSTTVTIPCPPGTESATGCKDDASIAVSTVATDPENDVLTYNYTVSGGRIVGSGANVSWDLTGVQAGTYTITSAVDDGCGVCGTTQTKTVTVAACADCKPICSCPTLSVSGPSAAVKTGEPMTFTANVSGGTQTSVTYNWTVSAGSIISGQGTPSITVDTAGLSGQTVTATVDIAGDLCAECDKSESTSGIVETPAPINPRKTDEFGALQNDDIKARLDSFAVELQNDPSATATIFNYGTPAQVRRREALMRTYLTSNRGIDASRLNFVNAGAGDIKTELWVVPAGATAPTPGM